ncbi:MAG: hypothetical protein R3F35_07985 [Myxococcota bacterium]
MQRWTRLVSIGVLAGAIGLLVACATSRIERARRDPDATESSLAFEKRVVVALVRDGALRRSAEDEMVGAFR